MSSESFNDPAGAPAQVPALPAAWLQNGLHSADWEALPPKARHTYRLSTLVPFAGLGVGANVLAWVGFAEEGWLWTGLAAAALLALLAWGWVYGGIRHRRTRYLLDADGLRIRRGWLFRRETRVPRTRVQHLDLERGPVERALGLATLVVHTAGTRMNAVNLAGVSVERGRELRNDLVDREDGDDDAV
jgi:hypothetical protein